jgi:ABC-type transport system involved in cytochrome c biogenesis ATPase subunit
MTGLTKHYPGVEALTDISLEVPAGSIYGFLGPNGAGKSTAIKVLAGLTRPTRGSASVAGIPIAVGPGHLREVGYLAQDPPFYDWMSGRETLRFVASLYPATDRADHGRIQAVLDRVGLADAADRRTSTYSGGMRQRLGIAQALIGSPRSFSSTSRRRAAIGRREVLDHARPGRSHGLCSRTSRRCRASAMRRDSRWRSARRSAPTRNSDELRPGPVARRRQRHDDDCRRHRPRSWRLSVDLPSAT